MARGLDTYTSAQPQNRLCSCTLLSIMAPCPIELPPTRQSIETTLARQAQSLWFRRTKLGSKMKCCGRLELSGLELELDPNQCRRPPRHRTPSIIPACVRAGVGVGVGVGGCWGNEATHHGMQRCCRHRQCQLALRTRGKPTTHSGTQRA